MRASMKIQSLKAATQRAVDACQPIGQSSAIKRPFLGFDWRGVCVTIPESGAFVPFSASRTATAALVAVETAANNHPHQSIESVATGCNP